LTALLALAVIAVAYHAIRYATADEPELRWHRAAVLATLADRGELSALDVEQLLQARRKRVPLRVIYAILVEAEQRGLVTSTALHDIRTTPDGVRWDITTAGVEWLVQDILAKEAARG
jgi:DNA-binding PadR family transcriptional regulator